ncbi:unnamed protein product [Penicillium olsonii]|uniref:Something about silencing protein 4 domain-containing protein n=1 Tax=Penicillium olsonii TaxID=99116 RepID=A0A9W4HH14_PENOL|nr:unnamed protein product [Penicillium olsonii]CAG8037199.1 unnamed protein product [Penicillium olsonii]CAG8093815.1 unnamed protein product [Penicillium olsonii]
MALLSRPSLRGSVRRADSPLKPTRDRRKSSPDCLDTTVDEQARTSPLKSRRTQRRTSSSSINTIASVGQLATPATRNGNGKSRAHRDTTTPTADLLRGVHESPDPLDTISPAPKQRNLAPAIPDDVRPPASPVKRPRRNDLPRGDGASATPDHKSDAEQTGEKSTGRRSLRSTDTGSRCKSELAQYFHNYEQIISLSDPEPEFLAAKTTLTLIDDLPRPLPTPPHNPTPFGNPLLNPYGCEKLALPNPPPDPSATDPLSEETYFRAHRKFERQEKQLRNIERNRAQHEQQVLERLLDELRGHEWLRTMGLPNVHEPEKKNYEPKREILIQELVTLVNKFQAWKDEERRRRLDKEKPDESGPRKHSRVEDDSSPAPADLQSTPDPNDVDALAARQLHQEARSAGAKSRKRKSTKSTAAEEEPKPSPKRKKPDTTTESKPPAAPVPPKNLKQASLSLFWAPAPREGPFTSFFRQRHVRDAAIAAAKGIRRSGSRSSLAFGHPVPEVPEVEFELPGEILTEEAILQSQRKRRRLKRKSQG